MAHHVYLMVNGDGFTKIGMSAKPSARISSIRTSSAVAVDLVHTWSRRTRKAASDMERAMHDLCRPRRAKREWHRLRLEEVKPIGDAWAAGDLERASALAEAICEMRDNEDRAEALYDKRARLNPRWRKEERDHLHDEAEAFERISWTAADRASALGYETELTKWMKGQAR